MVEVTVAVIAAISTVIAALIEKARRENKKDHATVQYKLDSLGKSLGRSIDRVEQSSLRTEAKLDQHIRDHAKGDFD